MSQIKNGIMDNQKITVETFRQDIEKRMSRYVREHETYLWNAFGQVMCNRIFYPEMHNITFELLLRLLTVEQDWKKLYTKEEFKKILRRISDGHGHHVINHAGIFFEEDFGNLYSPRMLAEYELLRRFETATLFDKARFHVYDSVKVYAYDEAKICCSNRVLARGYDNTRLTIKSEYVDYKIYDNAKALSYEDALIYSIRMGFPPYAEEYLTTT